jgi:hypothetical protein
MTESTDKFRLAANLELPVPIEIKKRNPAFRYPGVFAMISESAIPFAMAVISDIYRMERFPGLAFGDFKIHPAITPTARAPNRIKALEAEIFQTRN